MAVYVDHARLPFGRMLMSHLVADSREELYQMVDRIGVARRWLQAEGTPREHFDICESKRTVAIGFGAIPVSPRELIEIGKLRGIG